MNSPFSHMAAVLGDHQPRPTTRAERNAGTRTDRIREALRLRGPLDTEELARVAGVTRATVWGLLKDDIRRGRLRKVPGSRPMLIEAGAPFAARCELIFYAIEAHGLPDADLLVLLDHPAEDDPWPGWWTGEGWVGQDGFPCKEPTHWANWPRGVR